MVSWKRNTNGMCPEVDIRNETIIYGSTSYTITELQENSNYTTTVTAINAAGRVPSAPVTVVTKEGGKGYYCGNNKKLNYSFFL